MSGIILENTQYVLFIVEGEQKQKKNDMNLA